MRAALVIAAKDLRQKIRDRSAIILSVVAPFALAALFSAMIPGQADSFHASYVVVDLDGGSISRALVDGPLAGLSQANVATISRVPTEVEARAQVNDRAADAALIIPAGFSAAVQAGQATELTVVASASATLAAQVLRSVLTSFGSQVEAVQLAAVTVLVSTGGRPDPSLAAELAAEAMALPEPVVLAEARTENRVASSKTYYGASMAVLFVFFAAQFGVVSLLAERRNGTLARMLAAPITARTVLAGKVIVSIVLAVVSMSIIVIGTTLLLGASWGDPFAVAALVVATSLAASGIALLVVGFARTEDQAGSLTAIVAMTLAVLGGSFFPMSQAPEGMATLSVLTPHAWFLRGINDLASGGGIALVAPSLAVLVAIAVVAGGLGLWRARRVVTSR
jgi:ABC-2 type transport system permease protein